MTHRTATVALVALLALAGCGTASDEGAAPTPTTTSEGLTGELTVFAAASLEPALDEVADAFRTEHPGVTFAPVTYDGSSTLVTQLAEGARADVLATADEANMQTALDEGVTAGDPVVFTTNTLQIVVPAGNPDGVSDLADLAALADGGGKVVVCAPEVPCGAAAERVLDAADVDLAPASLEQNVTAVLTKVQAGEADAGLVYRTDVLKGGDDVEGVDFPESDEVVNDYPAVVLTGAQDDEAARAFVAFLASPAAQAILTARGFAAP